MDIKKMKADPRHQQLEALIGEVVKEFISLFHDVHETFDAEPHEFVNGAMLRNKETSERTLYKLTLVAESNVSEERINQFTEELIALEDSMNKKWEDK